MLHVLNTFRIKANNSFLIRIQGRHAEGFGYFFPFLLLLFHLAYTYKGAVLVNNSMLRLLSEGWQGRTDPCARLITLPIAAGCFGPLR